MTPGRDAAQGILEICVRLSEEAAGFIASSAAVALHAVRIPARRLNAATAYLADAKAQFADQRDHFGLMDRGLESLTQQQAPTPRARSDPRL
jgi:hypothetical protein